MGDARPRRIRNVRDFWAGLLFVAAGGAAVLLGRAYPVGTTAAMGPGYFPRVLGWILVGLGALTTLRALRPAAAVEALGTFRLRPLVMVTVSVAAFALALPRAGLVVASLLVVLLSRTAAPGYRWREVVLFGAGLTVACAAIFVWGLKMPMALWPSLGR